MKKKNCNHDAIEWLCGGKSKAFHLGELNANPSHESAILARKRES